jgi:hypothetical protein
MFHGILHQQTTGTLAARWTDHGGFLQNNLPFPRLQRLFPGSQSAAVGELNQVITNRAGKIAEALPTAHVRYVDEGTGEVVIAVALEPVMETKREALAEALGVPVRIGVEDPTVPQPAMR